MNAARVTARLAYSRWLWSLGATRLDSLSLVASYNSRIARKRLRLSGVLPVRVNLRLRNGKLPFVFREASDFVVLNEVFREKQYELPSTLAPEVVLDLGANTGLSPLFFRSLYPQARIIAVEAQPTTFARLQENTQAWPQVEALHLAASDREGEVELFSSNGRNISSSVFERKQSPLGGSSGLATTPTRVPGSSLSNLLTQCGGYVGVLKFDIEGAEQRVFENFNQWEQIGTLIGEVHPDLFGGTLDSFLGLFPRHQATIVQTMGVRAVVRLDPR